jgi:hypothetical protein
MLSLERRRGARSLGVKSKDKSSSKQKNDG